MLSRTLSIVVRFAVQCHSDQNADEMACAFGHTAPRQAIQMHDSVAQHETAYAW